MEQLWLSPMEAENCFCLLGSQPVCSALDPQHLACQKAQKTFAKNWINEVCVCGSSAIFFFFPFLSQSHQLLVEQWRVNCININKHGLPLIICVTLCRGLPSPDPGFLLYKVRELNQVIAKVPSCYSIQWLVCDDIAHVTVLFTMVGAANVTTHSSSKRTWVKFYRQGEKNSKRRVFSHL